MTRRHRYRLGPRTGPWRETTTEARADAVAAGYGSKDERTGVCYVDEMVTIEAEAPSAPDPAEDTE